jgi:hypothetical protein
VTLIRESEATYTDRYGQLIVASGEEGEEQARQTGSGWLIEEGSQNFLLNSGSPATQAVTLTAGDYTLSVVGTGSADTNYGSATDGAPLSFTSAGETLTVTVTGTLDRFWLEPLPYQTSYIPTSGTAATREPELYAINSQQNVILNSSEWSVAFNLQAHQMTVGSCLLSIETDPASGFDLSVNADLTLRLLVKDADGTDYILDTTTTAADGGFYSIVIAYESPTLVLRVNGTDEATETIPEFCKSLFEGGTYIGSEAGVRTANLEINDLRFYEYALNLIESVFLSRG